MCPHLTMAGLNGFKDLLDLWFQCLVTNVRFLFKNGALGSRCGRTVIIRENRKFQVYSHIVFEDIRCGRCSLRGWAMTRPGRHVVS